MQLVPQDLKKESVRVRIRIVFVVRDFCAFGSTPPVQAGHGLQTKPDTWLTSPVGFPVDATAGPG